MKYKKRFALSFLASLFLISPMPADADEATVREYFSDIPAMVDIARCESGFRQYANSGNALRGGASAKMIGVFQLHSDYHLTAASALGMDIETLDGNLAYARHLYDNEGLKPWSPCLHAVSEISLSLGKIEIESSQSESVSVSETERSVLLKKIEELQQQVYLLQIEILKRQLSGLQGFQ